MTIKETYFLRKCQIVGLSYHIEKCKYIKGIKHEILIVTLTLDISFVYLGFYLLTTVFPLFW